LLLSVSAAGNRDPSHCDPLVRSQLSLVHVFFTTEPNHVGGVNVIAIFS